MTIENVKSMLRFKLRKLNSLGREIQYSGSLTIPVKSLAPVVSSSM